MMKRFRKVYKQVFLVFVMLFSIFGSSIGSVNAAPSYTGPFTRVKEIKYPSWWADKIPGVRGWSTWMCTFNGQWSYCLEASKKSPFNGTYTASVINNNPMVKKLLYYGFGGPDQKIFLGESTETAYLYTHVLLSYAYSGNMCGADLDALESLGIGLKSDYKYVQDLPEPTKADFGGSDVARFTATFDRVNKQQVTNTITFNGSSNATINVPLQDEVTLHNVTTGATQTGGTVTIYGGQSFYLTAPLKDMGDYTSGNIAGDNCRSFQPLAISPGGSFQSHGSWAWDSASLSYSVDWEEVGYTKLKKESEIKDITDNNNLYELAGAKYGIYVGDTLIQEVVIDETGYALSEPLVVGEYTVREIEAPKGYDLDPNVYTLIIKEGGVTELVLSDTPKNDPIGIEIVKNDSENLGMPQGDATLEGAEFTVKYYPTLDEDFKVPETEEEWKEYKENNPKAREWVLQTKALSYDGVTKYITGLSDTYKVDGDEFYRDSDGTVVLPLGTISIEETKAPKGYLLEGAELTVTDSTTGEVTSVKDVKYVARVTEQYQGAKLEFGNDANQMVVKEKVKQQKIQIHKFGEKDGVSGIVEGLAGAEFTFKLKSEVDRVGWDNATTYDVVTTGEDGRATTKYLPFGTYLVKETKTPQDYITAPDFIVTISKDYSEYPNIDQIQIIDINNRPYTSQLKIVKKDLDSGKNVSLNSASFKVKAREDIVLNGKVIYKAGDTITQKISGKKYDTFTTNADNVIIPSNGYSNPDGEEGSIMLPLQLDPGKYYIEEVRTPAGFLELENPVEFTIENVRDYTTDEDGDPILEVVVKNDQPVGELELRKSLHDWNYDSDDKAVDRDFDLDLVDRTDLSGIKYRLTAKEDIVSPIDGSIIYAKDAVIGEYNLDSKGFLRVSDLPIGVGGSVYQLQEIETLDGLVLDSTKYDVVFTQEDLTTKVYTVAKDLVNYPTRYEFSKTDVAGNELPGAHMQLLNSTGNVVADWTSTDTPYLIQGLKVGETYTLHEDLAPLGYVKASDVTFTVGNTTDLETVTMVDKIMTIDKVDADSKGLEGATLQVIDEQGNVIDKWVTDASGKHNVSGLEVGKTYTLQEVDVPDGYTKALDVTFTVLDDGKNQSLTMTDKKLIAHKNDMNGKGLVGAHMSVLDEQGNTVESWVTDGKGHEISNLKVGSTYILREVKAPDGYIKQDDVKFTVLDDGKDQTVTMLDNYTEVAKKTNEGNLLAGATLQVVDTDGKEIDQWVSCQNIVEMTDVIKSALDKDGVYTGKANIQGTSLDVKITKDGDDYSLRTLNGTDEYSYYKVDIDGNETYHMVRGLVANGSYVLKEVKAPNEYVISKELPFTVKDKDITLVMTDKQVEISKQDVGGKELEGAHMQIVDKDGNIIDEWISTDKPHYASNLIEGNTYTLKEDLAPLGYNTANEFEFTVSYDKDTQKVEMVDTMTKVSKVDEDGKYLKGATLQVISKKTKNIVDQWVTGEHIFDITSDMKAELERGNTVSNMKVDIEDDGVTQYTIKPIDGTNEYSLMLVKDGEAHYYMVDIEGNETSHLVSGLHQDGEYTLVEVEAPNGYATAESQDFKVEDKDVVLTMTDEITKVEISKQDATTGKELPGATLQVFDKDGNLVEEWVSSDTPHMIKGLSVGETYTLVEKIAPKGYEIANKIEFTISDTGDVQKVVMKDELSPVVNTGDDTDLMGYALSGLGAGVAILGMIAFRRRKEEL